MDKKVSLEVKTHFSVSDHVTWGVARWRHKLNHTCPQWMLSKFGPMKVYMCWVTANSFFPSNGLKRYCNGPLIPVFTCTTRISTRARTSIKHSCASTFFSRNINRVQRLTVAKKSTPKNLFYQTYTRLKPYGAAQVYFLFISYLFLIYLFVCFATNHKYINTQRKKDKKH